MYKCQNVWCLADWHLSEFDCTIVIDLVVARSSPIDFFQLARVIFHISNSRSREYYSFYLIDNSNGSDELIDDSRLCVEFRLLVNSGGYSHPHA